MTSIPPLCPVCATPARDSNQFCTACGSRLTCPNGHELGSRDLRFCETCGVSLAEELRPVRPGSGARLLAAVGASVVALGVASAVAATFLMGSDDTDPEAAAPVPTRAAAKSTSATPAPSVPPASQSVGQQTAPVALPTAPPAPTPTSVPAVQPTAVPPTPTQPPPTATNTIAPATATSAPVVECYPVSVTNPTACIIGTFPQGSALACVKVNTFVGLSTSDTRFKQWIVTGATLNSAGASTTFLMPANPVSVTLSCGP